MTVFEQLFFRESVPTFLAPMAGFSDLHFRSMCKACGADVLETEFVMCEAVLAAEARASVWRMLDFDDSQRPVGVQLFGAEPERMAAAARKVADLLAPDYIDINFGCPAPRIVGQGAGSALLGDLPLMGRIAEAVVRAVPELPVTAKMRTGIDNAHIVAVEAALILEKSGIRALSIHGRTRAQGYSGDADWALVSDVARRLRIPVVGNGSVGGVYDASIIRNSGVRGVMVGRAALGNPWIFARLKAELAGLPPPPETTPGERIGAMLRYAEAIAGPEGAIGQCRPRLKPFSEGLPGARRLRREMDAANTVADLRELVAGFLAEG